MDSFLGRLVPALFRLFIFPTSELADFLAVSLRLADPFAVDFVVDFLAVDFFAVDLVVDVFLDAGFFAAGFFAAGFFAVDFLVVVFFRGRLLLGSFLFSHIGPHLVFDFDPVLALLDFVSDRGLVAAFDIVFAFVFS